MSLPMIDISSYQHPNDSPIDWCAVAGHGIRAVMIKATEGTDYINPWLGRDAHGARSAGLHVGYYHFAQPGLSDGVLQAKFVVNVTRSLPRDIGIALDLEITGGLSWSELANCAKAFLDTLSNEQIGSPLYINDYFLSNLPGAPFGHHLWLASPGSPPRRQVWAWQSSPDHVPGIGAPVDIDTLYGPIG